MGYQKMDFFESLYHDPLANNKWVGPNGNMEAVYSKETGKLVTNTKYKGTFNFFGPDMQQEHFVADVIPYKSWGTN